MTVLIPPRKYSDFFHLKNTEKPLNNLFIKFLDFKLTPSSKKNYRTLLIYKSSMLESHIQVQVKMGIRKFLSAYLCSDCDESFYKSTLENFFKEKCAKIFSEEKNFVKHVYSIHILHMRTIQWKLNQSIPRLNEIPLTLYLENFKKSIKSHDYYAKFLPMPSPSQSANFSFDSLKKFLVLLLKQDYLNFQKDERDEPKKEDFLNFGLVLEKAYIFDNLQIRFPGFLDNDKELLQVSHF